MKTNTIRRKSRTTACALALTGSILGSAAFAQVDLNVNIDFNAGTGMYTYTHAVLNKGQTFDLAIVNLNHPTLVKARAEALSSEKSRLERDFKNARAPQEERDERASELLARDPLPSFVSIRVAWLRKKLGAGR